jgi:hypothetical protein
LEVNAGYSEENNLVKGDKIDIQNILENGYEYEPNEITNIGISF